MSGTIKYQLDAVQEKVVKRSFSYVSRTLVFFVIKLFAFIQKIPTECWRQCNVHQPKGLINDPEPNTNPEVYVKAVRKEERVNPCLERIQRLERMLEELNSKPTEIPAEKDQIIQQSLDRIKNMEGDLEKTKRVIYPPNLLISLDFCLYELNESFFFQVVHATVLKQLQIAELMENMQESKFQASQPAQSVWFDLCIVLSCCYRKTNVDVVWTVFAETKVFLLSAEWRLERRVGDQTVRFCI